MSEILTIFQIFLNIYRKNTKGGKIIMIIFNFIIKSMLKTLLKKAVKYVLIKVIHMLPPFIINIRLHIYISLGKVQVDKSHNLTRGQPLRIPQVMWNYPIPHDLSFIKHPQIRNPVYPAQRQEHLCPRLRLSTLPTI